MASIGQVLHISFELKHREGLCEKVTLTFSEPSDLRRAAKVWDAEQGLVTSQLREVLLRKKCWGHGCLRVEHGLDILEGIRERRCIMVKRWPQWHGMMAGKGQCILRFGTGSQGCRTRLGMNRCKKLKISGINEVNMGKNRG